MITASEVDRPFLAECARRWSEAGFAVVPAKADGSKRPDLATWASIANGETAPPDISWIASQIYSDVIDGIGLVMGLPSGNAEMVELESRVMSRYGDLATHAQQTGVFHLFDKLTRGCVEQTPSGGIHAYLRVSDGPALGNTVFARRPRSPGEAKHPVLAESRGQGGYSVCAPSGGRTHDSKQPYKFLMGGPESVPTFTSEERDQLHDLFRFLDEMPQQVEEPPEFDPPERVGGAGGCDGALRPGDDFNERGDWGEILVGWTKVYTQGEGTENQRTHWRRPGKTNGTSATTGGEGDWLYVFSTSTELPAGRAMTKFTVYAHLHHGGDFTAAAAELARQGYGAARTGVHSGAAAPIPEYVPFPTNALVGAQRAFVEQAAAAARCDPAFIALPMLAATAAAIGNSRRLCLKPSWKVPPNLWTATVSESGNQKSVGFRMALGPIMERQRMAFQRHKEAYREYEVNLERWKSGRRQHQTSEPYLDKPEPPIVERFVVSDTTIEALATTLQNASRGVLVQRDELKGWFGSFDRYAGNGKAKTDESHWLSMYNGESLLVDRKTGESKTIFVPSASVSLTGCIPPGSLRRALSLEHRESGLAARLLMACPPRRKKEWTDATIPYELEHAYTGVFDRLYSLTPVIVDGGDPRPVGVGLTDEAKSLFVDYYNRHNDEQMSLEGDIALTWSKLEETVARLALVTHYVRWAGGEEGVSQNTIDEGDITYGIMLVDWFKHEAKRIYAMLGGGEQENDGQRLVSWLTKRGGEATAREVQQGCRWLKESGQAEAALSSLVGAGLGRWVVEDGAGSRNRGRRFVLGNSGGQSVDA